MIRYSTFIGMFIAIAALALPLGARAAAGWTDYVKVAELIPTGRHYYEVRLVGATNPSGCRVKDWYYLNYEAPGADKMFDLFVDRMQSTLQLRVYVSGVCNINGYAEISSVNASPNAR